MKINTLLFITSVTFLSYYGYKKLFNTEESIIKPELRIDIPEDIPEDIPDDIPDENNDKNIFENVDQKTEIDEPLTPLQKLVQDHFQIAHR